MCPFRTDCLKGWLTESRADEIVNSIMDMQQSFPCHETTDENDEGTVIETKKSQHCAGAMILLEKLERPNQMMRISERLGFYDRHKLDMNSPVFDDGNEFIEHHT